MVLTKMYWIHAGRPLSCKLSKRRRKKLQNLKENEIRKYAYTDNYCLWNRRQPVYQYKLHLITGEVFLESNTSITVKIDNLLRQLLSIHGRDHFVKKNQVC